ncbi:unnamed protein product [Ceratitis capitata]|uniref:(Mediterranean fruit fly) hypothetical protein n=1 Tax=Ceratitis capitata TaxID=7213 RepID=A0A811UPU8_CERCA|nr:unnamed protein product [Ceratitis capitata]
MGYEDAQSGGMCDDSGGWQNTYQQKALKQKNTDEQDDISTSNNNRNERESAAAERISHKLPPIFIPDAQELESYDLRANFAYQFNKISSTGNHSNSRSNNAVRYPQRNQGQRKFHQKINRPVEPKRNAMDVDSSASVVQPQKILAAIS